MKQAIFLLSFFLLSIIQSIHSIDNFEFIHLPSDLTLNETETALFHCESSQSSQPNIWLKNGQTLNYSDPRHSLLDSKHLQITDLQISDEAFYICVATSDDKLSKKYAQAHLKVIVPPYFIEYPLDAEHFEGEYAEFQCLVRGKPLPDIVWLKNGRSLMNIHKFHYEFYETGQLLKINDLSFNDTGVYECLIGKGELRSGARLEIKKAIEPYFKIKQMNVSVYEDQFIRLECFAGGQPRPQVLWYRNGLRIRTDTRVNFDTFGYLSIGQVRSADSGTYTCVAENPAGSVLHQFQLTVKDILGRPIISDEVIDEAVGRARQEVRTQSSDSIAALFDRRRPKTMSDLLKLVKIPREDSNTLDEEIYERALDIIFRYISNITVIDQNNSVFINDDILSHRQLRRISDLSGCHRHKAKPKCDQVKCLNKYRTIDGTCNNLEDPRKGAANTALRRLLPAEYENGFSVPKGWDLEMLYNGYKLPKARVVSLEIVRSEKIRNDRRFSSMLMQWGQWLDHDISHTVMALSLNRFSNGIACRDSCTNDQPCFPILTEPLTTSKASQKVECMEFVRSAAICGSGETSILTPFVHQREQVNQVTSFIDASQVYGSHHQDSFDIRARPHRFGYLKVYATPRHPKGLLPFNLDTNMDCQRDNTSTIGCFLAGDYRANEQLGLIAMHNLFVREHNRLVEILTRLNPSWSGDQLYEEARKIVGAQMQIITYEHWLPYIIGTYGMKMLGSYSGYDSKLDPSVSNEFATAAFRFGHGLIQPITQRLNSSFQPIPEGNLPLRDSFFAPQRFFLEGGPDPILRGLFATPAKLNLQTQLLNTELTDHLFHIVRHVSQDLAALNIQRGRDHGLPGYNDYRVKCGLKKATSFKDLGLDKVTSAKLVSLYGNVNNIDLWVGGMLEKVVEGGKVGPTFLCIIVDQMKALRAADRFWYENKGVWSEGQLEELRRVNLAALICDNGDDIKKVQKDVFVNGRMIECDRIQRMNVDVWKDSSKETNRETCLFND